jgi:hypothetical protein
MLSGISKKSTPKRCDSKHMKVSQIQHKASAYWMNGETGNIPAESHIDYSDDCDKWDEWPHCDLAFSVGAEDGWEALEKGHIRILAQNNALHLEAIASAFLRQRKRLSLLIDEELRAGCPVYIDVWPNGQKKFNQTINKTWTLKKFGDREAFWKWVKDANPSGF